MPPFRASRRAVRQQTDRVIDMLIVPGQQLERLTVETHLKRAEMARVVVIEAQRRILDRNIAIVTADHERMIIGNDKVFHSASAARDSISTGALRISHRQRRRNARVQIAETKKASSTRQEYI
jgi:hypothetical protein